MSALLLPPRAVDPAPVAADLIHHVGSRVQPAAHFPLLSTLQWSNPSSPLTDWPTEHTPVASCSKLETLPVEIVNQILSHLTHPRSRLPGLTEAQSAHDFPSKTRSDIKAREDLTTPPDSDRWAADLFNWNALQHPFHALSLTSRRCNQLVESFCAHMVRSCNKFGLPFNQLDQCGSKCVYPDMSGIVYRRLWLQHAPRHCVYCFAVLDCYPFPLLKRVIAACKDCFYRQTLTVEEVEVQYHISAATILSSPLIRTQPGSIWVLRIDVEALAQRLYGTRGFHNAHQEQFGKPCSICAITKFAPEYRVTKSRPAQKTDRRIASLKKKTKRPTRP